MPHQKKLEWTQWITGSRNLSRLHNAQRAEQSLHTGTEDVIRKLTSLPSTKHDIAAAEKFVVDAWPVQGVLPGPADASTVLLITVHGQFEEGKHYHPNLRRHPYTPPRVNTRRSFI
jgi:nuclear RNA export factor